MGDKKVRIIVTAENQTKRALSGVVAGFQKAGSQLTGMGKKMTTRVTAPVVGAFALMAKEAGDFQAQINILKIATRDLGADMQARLGEAALAIGGDLDLVGVDAVQATDAMTNFAKSGLTVADMFGGPNALLAFLEEGADLGGALRAAIDLAAASDLDLARASDVVSIAMATFGIKAEDAVGIADNFVQTADASVAEVSELADAMANAGPVFASYGIPLEDVNTALGILSQRGIKGAEAGTALRSMMNNILRPTASVQEALEALNVSLFDEAGQLKSLPDIMAAFEKAMALGSDEVAGLTEEQRLQHIQTLAGTFGMKAMTSLLAEGAEGWQNMEKQVGDAASASDVAAVRTQGLNAAIEAMRGIIQTFMVKAGTPLIEKVITPLVQRIGEFVSKLVDLDPKLIGMGLAIAGILAAAGPVLMILGTMVSTIGLLLSPVGLVIAGIIALGAAFVIWRGGLDGAMETLRDLWATIRDFGARAISVLKTAFDIAKQAVMNFIAEIRDRVAPVLASFREIWESIWPRLVQTFQAAWNRIQGIVQIILNNVVPFIQEKVEAATTFFSLKFRGIVLWFERNMPLIQETAETVMTALASAIRIALDAIILIWDWAWPHIQTVVDGVWETIKTVVGAAIDIVLGIVKTAMLLIGGEWEGAWSTIKDVMSGVWDTVKGVVETALNTILGLFGTTLDDIVTAIKGKVSDFLQVGGDIVQGLIEGIRNAWGDLKGMFQGLINLLPKWAQTLLGVGSGSKVFRDIGEAISIGLMEGIRDVQHIPIAAIETLVDNVVNVMAAMVPAIEAIRAQFRGEGKGRTRDIIEQWSASIRLIFQTLRTVVNLTKDLPNLKAIGEDVANKLTAGMKLLISKILQMALDVTDLINETTPEILSVMRAGFSTLQSGLRVVLDIIELGEVAENWRGIGEDFAANVMNAAEIFLRVVLEMAGRVSSLIDETTSEILETMGSAFGGLGQMLNFVLKLAGIEEFKGVRFGLVERIKKDMQRLALAFTDWQLDVDVDFFTALGQKIAAIRDVIGGMVGIVSDVNTAAEQGGLDIGWLQALMQQFGMVDWQALGATAIGTPPGPTGDADGAGMGLTIGNINITIPGLGTFDTGEISARVAKEGQTAIDFNILATARSVG